MQKSIFSLCMVLMSFVQTSWAQSYVVSGIEKTDKEGMQYEVLGKMGKTIGYIKKMVLSQLLHNTTIKCNWLNKMT